VVTGLGFGVLLMAAIGNVAVGGFTGLTTANANGNVEGLAALIFSRYLWAFELTSALLITAALGAMVLAHRERTTPKPTQRELSRRRVASGHVAPEPPPGVYALHNAVDMPALLPDGSTTARSVSKAVTQRDVELGRDPQSVVTTDLETEDRIEAERQIEAAARGRDEQA
jgi:NADH-quinone oxidoreductase subunit J